MFTVLPILSLDTRDSTGQHVIKATASNAIGEMNTTPEFTPIFYEPDPAPVIFVGIILTAIGVVIWSRRKKGLPFLYVGPRATASLNR